MYTDVMQIWDLEEYWDDSIGIQICCAAIHDELSVFVAPPRGQFSSAAWQMRLEFRVKSTYFGKNVFRFDH